ncbi:MAG: hypothetical protein ACRDHU_06230 [Actinomycetota bacterium]
MPDEPAAPEQEETDEGYVVIWEPAYHSPDDIQAELPDGTRLKAVLLLADALGSSAPCREEPAPEAW